MRKQVPVDALSGLWLETLAMLPICLIYALWQAQDGHAVFTLADHLTVMVNGQVVASDTPAAVRADAGVQAAYLGEEAGEAH